MHALLDMLAIGVAADIHYFPSMVQAVRPMYFVPEAQGATFQDRELESRERDRAPARAVGLYGITAYARRDGIRCGRYSE